MNVADDIDYSGTVGAAKEQRLMVLRALRFPSVFPKAGGFHTCPGSWKTGIGGRNRIVTPERTVLNINFPPAEFGRVKGIGCPSRLS